MCLTATTFQGNHSSMYLYVSGITNIDVLVDILFEPVLCHAALCLLVAGYLEMKLHEGQVAPLSVFTEEM